MRITGEVFDEADYGIPKEKEKQEKITPLFTNRSCSWIFDTPPVEPDWLFEGMLPTKIVGAVFAQDGVGKTMLLLRMSMALAAGVSFGPFQVPQPRKVLFLGGEDSELSLHRRALAAVRTMGLPDSQLSTLKENFQLESMVGKSRKLIEPAGRNGLARTTKVYQQLELSLKSIPGLDLLVIDPKSRFDGLKENDANDGTDWITCLDQLSTKFGIAVLFSHHDGKDKTKSGSGRGSSAVRAGTRWTMVLERGQEAGTFSAQLVKFSDGPSWRTASIFSLAGGAVEEAEGTPGCVTEKDVVDYVSQNDDCLKTKAVKALMQGRKTTLAETREAIENCLAEKKIFGRKGAGSASKAMWLSLRDPAQVT